MHQSWFSYNLSRPYPFPWFTPVVFVGGLLFTALFSAVNVATNGYYLKTIYTTDPNTTIAERHWFTDAPWSWGDKLKPTCQTQALPIGYQFFSTNLGLSYTLESVSQYNPHTNETVPYPSLQYLNQTLQDCYVDEVILYFSKSDQSENGQTNWWSWGDSNAAATARCRIDTSVGPVNATFSTKYQSNPKAFPYVIQNNYTSAASMWWGTRLLNLYWSSTITEMAYSYYPVNDTYWATTPIWTKGRMTLTPNNTADMKSYEYFNLVYYFISGDGNIWNSLSDLDVMYNNPDGLAYSGPLTEGLTWAKIMSSMILTDLGESRSPNLLLDPILLQWALQYPDDVFRKQLDDGACPYNASDPNNGCALDWVNYLGIAAPGLDPASPYDQQTPMNQSYDLFKDKMGPLGTKKAEIYLQYACSVPEMKDGGTLFLAVLIADLVFLQALWTILNMIAGVIVTKHDRLAMACHPHAMSDYGLVSIGPVQGMEGGLAKSGLDSETTSREVLVTDSGNGPEFGMARNGYLPVR